MGPDHGTWPKNTTIHKKDFKKNPVLCVASYRRAVSLTVNGKSVHKPRTLESGLLYFYIKFQWRHGPSWVVRHSRTGEPDYCARIRRSLFVCLFVLKSGVPLLKQTTGHGLLS